MTRWQRIVRALLAIFALVFSVGVYLAIRERQPAAPAGDAGRTDLQAIAESVGGTAQLAKALRRDLDIEYGRMLMYADGRMRIVDGLTVRARRAGRDFVLTARQGEGREDQTAMTVEGAVRLTSSDGLALAADRAVYDSGEDIVRVPGHVEFSRRRMTGSADGATYDRGRDVLWMQENAVIDVAPAEDGSGRLALRSGPTGFARRDRYIRFESRMSLDQQGQRAEADRAMAFLQPDEDLLTMVELRGNSTVALETTGAGQLQRLSAQDINLHYREDGRTLERVTLANAASIEFAGGEGQSGGRRLVASWMDVTLEPDGTPLVVAARDQVELSLPADGAAPARRIRALSLEAVGEAGRGITAARFLDQVEFREARPARGSTPAGERRIRSRTLDTVVAPGFGTLEAATFGGGVRLSDADLEAGAPEAAYKVTQGTMQLRAGAGGPGAQVTDRRATIEARTIDIALESQSLVADQDVRSVLKASPRDGKTEGGVRRPGMLKDDQPVNVTATRLEYDGSNGRAVYTGEARLWQGETAVHGATITLDDQKGNLTASGGVRSTWRLQDTDPKTGVSEVKTTVATGEDLVYDDEVRRATYSTGARLNGPEGDLRAQKIELYLVPEGDRLERLEAYTDVTLNTEGRESTGARLSYFAADDRYVMATAPGAPDVRILEQLAQECRETLGKTLTFHRATDSIAVDGSDERRTQTISGGKCPERRSR